MIGTAIPGKGRWFLKGVVFVKKVLLTAVKKNFIKNLPKWTVKTKLSFIFYQEHFNSKISVFHKKTKLFCFWCVGALVLVFS